MVKQRNNLLVEIHQDQQLRKTSWQPHLPLKLDVPQAWILRRVADGYRLSDSRKPKAAPVMLSADDAAKGVELMLPGQPRKLILKISPLVSKFSQWAEGQRPVSSEQPASVLILFGRGGRVLKKQVVEKRFSNEKFSLLKSNGDWRLKILRPEVKAVEGEKILPNLVVENLAVADLSKITLTSGPYWWAIRPVQISPEGLGFAWLRKAGAYGVGLGLAAWIAMINPQNLTNSIIQATNRQEPPIANVTLTRMAPVKPAPVIAEPPVAALAPKAVAKPEMKAELAPQKSSAPEISKEIVQRPKTPAVPSAVAKQNVAPKKKASQFAKAEWVRSQMNSFAESKPEALVEPRAKSSEMKAALSESLAVFDKTKAPARTVELASLGPITLPSARSAETSSEEIESQGMFRKAVTHVAADEQGEERTVSGGLTGAQIDQAISQQITSVRDCYEQLLTRASGQEGRLVLSFVVSSSGRIETVRITDASLKDVPFQRCVLKEAKQWKFPSPVDGTQVTVSYPFLFKPVRMN